MSGSDIMYYSSLIVCVSLGSYYKKITNIEMKKNYGTGLGLMIVCLICGSSIYHSALMIWGNIIIIKCCDRRYMHQISMAYTWLYLLYLHWYVMNHYIIWIHQALALKLVGLAFEINAVPVKTEEKGHVSKTNIGDTETDPLEPSAADIIAYAYYFIGLHREQNKCKYSSYGYLFQPGIEFEYRQFKRKRRWKIFNDHFQNPFGVLGDCRIITEQKLKKACVCGLGYIIINMKYSPELYFKDIFYTTYGADFRYLYNIPQLAMNILHFQAVMMLCTSVFTETGFGVYPAKCQPTPGFGPTAQLSFISLAAASPDLAMEEEYNFSTTKCFDFERFLLGPKMRTTMGSWDMPTRFWFWTYVHKSFIKSNKEVRSALSFLAWTVWFGPTIPKFIISSTLWVYVHLEAEYSIMYDTSGPMKLPWDIGFSIMRIFCLLYLTPCFVVEDTYIVLKYYHSIFWVFHFILLVMMILSIIIYKTRRE